MKWTNIFGSPKEPNQKENNGENIEELSCENIINHYTVWRLYSYITFNLLIKFQGVEGLLIFVISTEIFLHDDLLKPKLKNPNQADIIYIKYNLL